MYRVGSAPQRGAENIPIKFLFLYMKVMCCLEEKGFRGVLTQQVSEPARTFDNTLLNPVTLLSQQRSGVIVVKFISWVLV